MLVLLAIVLLGVSAIILAGVAAWLPNSERLENKWFLLFAVFLGVWAVCNYIDSNTIFSPKTTALFATFDFVLAPFIGYSFLRFTTYIIYNPGKRVQRMLDVVTSARMQVVLFGSTALAAALALFGQVFTPITREASLVLELHWGMIPYSIPVVATPTLGIVLLMTAYKNSSHSDRRRLSFILLGFAGATITNVLTNLVFPVFIESRSVIGVLNVLGYLGIFFVAFCIYLAITMRKLFDLRVAIIRSLMYALLLATVTALYIGAVFLAGYILLDNGNGVSIPQLMVSSGVALFVAMTFQYLQRSFNRTTKRIFFRDSYEVQDVLNRLSDVTTNTIEVNELMKNASGLLTQTVKSTFCNFILVEGGKVRRSAEFMHVSLPSEQLYQQLQPLLSPRQPVITEVLGLMPPAPLLRKHGIEVVIPLYTKDTLMGFMVFGSKQNGMAFQQQDIQMLSLAGTALSVAIQNALRFEEISRFNETLQQKVEDATRKLRASNNKLRQLDATKDDFISMASHQLRTPLTSIKGYVSMVIEGDAGKISSMQRKLLTQAFISSQRMVYLISDLLNVSRLRTGKFIIETTPVNLAAVVQDEVKQLSETAAGRELELIYSKPEHFPTYLLDETKMRQVIMNFIDNAIYYTPSGGSIKVSLVERPQAIEFTVTDTGIGVPKNEQHHLFSKFYRAPNAKRARPDGTGLGLFMAKKVIVAQGGSVVFRSRENKGSTFGFLFSKEHLTQQAQDKNER